MEMQQGGTVIILPGGPYGISGYRRWPMALASSLATRKRLSLNGHFSRGKVP